MMPPSGLAIRAAEPRDLEAVRALLVETWHDTYDPLLGVDKVTEITNSWHSIEALGPQLALPDCSFLVAEEGGRIVGHVFANGRRLPALSSRASTCCPPSSGAASAARCSQRPSPATRARSRSGWRSQADNPKGVAFYRREGFQPVGEHMEDGIPHIRMEKRLV